MGLFSLLVLCSRSVSEAKHTGCLIQIMQACWILCVQRVCERCNGPLPELCWALRSPVRVITSVQNAGHTHSEGECL